MSEDAGQEEEEKPADDEKMDDEVSDKSDMPRMRQRRVRVANS